MREFRAAARRAARIRQQDDVACGREELRVELKAVVVLRDRAAVYGEDRRIASPGHVAWWREQEPLDARAVGTRIVDRYLGPERKRTHHHRVHVRELRELRTLQAEQLA